MRLALLAALALAAPAAAETLRLPGLAPDAPAPALACENVPFDAANCVRVLACVGDAGDWFDGEARGWDTGAVAGRLHGAAAAPVPCEGTWDSRSRPGVSRLACADGTGIDVIYTSIDNETGTVIGAGRATDGRMVRAWSGLEVLAFLTPDGRVDAELSCGSVTIPIS